MLLAMPWETFCRWEAYYELEPWGETRGDLRQLALAMNLLAGRLPRGTQIPSLIYPYWPDTGDSDLSAAIAEYHEYIDEWGL